MTPPRRKTAFYVAGLLGAAASGFLGQRLVPLAVKEAPAAQAAPESTVEKRLQAMEAKQDAMLSELRDIRETLAFVRGTLKLSGK